MQINRKIKRFYLGNIRKELKAAVENLSKQVYVPFPKEERRWISNYVYREFEIHIDSKGSIKGGLLRLIFSLVNFSFVRSLVADCYSNEGGDCHDPVTLFLLEVIKIWAGYTYYPEFIEDLKDNEKGSQYRYYAGVYIENVPTEATLHNFRDRVGEEKLQEVIRLLVKLFHVVGILSGRILCTDGTLIEAFARYRGCTYMETCCQCLQCPKTIVDNINAAILNTVKEMEVKDKNAAVVSIKMQCPRDEVIKRLIEMVKKKDSAALVEDIGAFHPIKLHMVKGKVTEFKVHKDYMEHTFGGAIKIPEGYSVEVISCSISRNKEGQYPFECPRASKDITARIGYRRRKDDPNKLEKVFGYKAVIMTSVEKEFNLEIPIAVMTGPGNINEAESFIKLHRKLKAHVPFKTEYQILDAGYDYEDVYHYIRDGNGKPLIDYNRRREKLDPDRLKKRGYNENGYPYAPCGRVCKPNGYDYGRKAFQNTCGKQCPSVRTQKNYWNVNTEKTSRDIQRGCRPRNCQG